MVCNLFCFGENGNVLGNIVLESIQFFGGYIFELLHFK